MINKKVKSILNRKYKFSGGRLTTHRLGSNTVDLGAQHLTCQGNIFFKIF